MTNPVHFKDGQKMHKHLIVLTNKHHVFVCAFYHTFPWQISISKRFSLLKVIKGMTSSNGMAIDEEITIFLMSLILKAEWV